MTIEPQKSGEALEDRVQDAEEFVLNNLPESEEKADVELDEDSSELGSEPTSNSVDSEDSQEGTVEEPEPTPKLAPVGPADFSSPTHISPQLLEEAQTFLNRYGIQTEHLTPKEVMDKIEKIKAAKEEAAQVYSRGRAIDGIERLLSFVPEGFVGEFKREDDMDINRAKALGFKVFESKEANLESSTGKSDGLVRLSDSILMIIPEEVYVANRLVKAERSAERRKAHSKQGGAPIDQSGADPLFPLIEL